MTRMAAIRIDIGNLSNAQDAQRLHDPDVQEQVADGIASGVTRFCAPE
jgi:N-acetylmuramoyl-L-alanine amidase